MNDIDDPIGEAEKPQSLRSPVLHPQHKIDAHSLTHDASALSFMVPGVPAGGRLRRPPTSGEEHHVIQLHYTTHVKHLNFLADNIPTPSLLPSSLPPDYVQQYLLRRRATLHIKLRKYIAGL